MRVQAGLENVQRGYTFDVKPRWNLADMQNQPEQACAAGLS